MLHDKKLINSIIDTMMLTSTNGNGCGDFMDLKEYNQLESKLCDLLSEHFCVEVVQEVFNERADKIKEHMNNICK